MNRRHPNALNDLFSFPSRSTVILTFGILHSNVNTVNSMRHIHVMLRMTCNPLNLLNLVPQVKIVECRNVTICKIWNHRVGVVPVTAWCHYWPIVFLLCHSSSIPEKYKYRKIWRLLRLWRNLFLHANMQNQDCEKGRHDTYLTLHLLITCIEKLSFGALQLSNHTWLICISDTGSSVPSCADPASPPSNKRMPGDSRLSRRGTCFKSVFAAQ